MIAVKFQPQSFPSHPSLPPSPPPLLRSVHIWLSDDQGGLLLQKRSEFKDTFPGRWDVSCGGHIESGDEAFPTAVRELEEELGLPEEIASKVEKLFTLACTNKGKTEKHGEFTCREFQDFFLLRVGEKHEMGMYKYPPGEVTEVRRGGREEGRVGRWGCAMRESIPAQIYNQRIYLLISHTAYFSIHLSPKTNRLK